MFKKNKSEKPTEGMPDIAIHGDRPNKLIILLFIAFAIIILMANYTYNKSSTKREPAKPPIEETYSVGNTLPENQSPTSAAKQPPQGEKTNQETQPPPENQTAPSPQLIEAQRQMLLAIEQERKSRLHTPMMVINNSSSSQKTTSTEPEKTTVSPQSELLKETASPAVSAIKATITGDRSKLLTEGTLIHAVQESATNSDLPGIIRAMVSEPVYSDDGSAILITAGSRLIGQYRSSVQQGQSRLFVAWTSLIMPNNTRIEISSPGTDNLGVAGVNADAIDYHFWERFGTSSLLSVIGAGASNVGVNSNTEYNSAQAYREAVSQSFAQAANDAYQQNGAIPPTLRMHQGKRIIVFVAHPLDFADVLKAKTPSVKIF